MKLKQKLRKKLREHKAQKKEEQKEYKKAYAQAKAEAEVKAREQRLESVRTKAKTRATIAAQPLSTRAVSGGKTALSTFDAGMQRYKKSYAKRHKGMSDPFASIGGIGKGSSSNMGFDALAFGKKPKKRRKKRKPKAQTITIKLS